MDSVRYWCALLAVLTVPPAILYWFIVHPFIGFWRKVGRTPTFSLLFVMFVGFGYALWLVRDTLLASDYGANPWLWAPAALCYGMAACISILVKRHLTFRILTGAPELDEGGKGGKLLDEGVYAHVRHPRYVAVVLGLIGWAFFTNYLAMYALIPVTLLGLMGIAHFEERELVERFGDEYADYRRRVPMFVPRFGRN